MEPDTMAEELANFRKMAELLEPTWIPVLEGMEIAGVTLPQNGVIGGDHLLFLDFPRRFDLERILKDAQGEVRRQLDINYHRTGILIADVTGHKMTDALLHARLHDAFLVGAGYELEREGQITSGLFERLNDRFCQSTSVTKTVTAIYGEVHGTGSPTPGAFRFVCAGHPLPVIYSKRLGRLIDIDRERIDAYPPLGMMPRSTVELPFESPLGRKRRYRVNELGLVEKGDVLLLYTDGLREHADHGYFPQEVERVISEHIKEGARGIAAALREDVLACEEPVDDVSYVVVKRTG